MLVLGHPTYSLSVTIFSLLVFAALGAAVYVVGTLALLSILPSRSETAVGDL